MDELDG